MGLSTVNCNCDSIEKGDAAQFGVILFPCVKRPSLYSEDDDDSKFQSNSLLVQSSLSSLSIVTSMVPVTLPLPY